VTTQVCGIVAGRDNRDWLAAADGLACKLVFMPLCQASFFG